MLKRKDSKKSIEQEQTKPKLFVEQGTKKDGSDAKIVVELQVLGFRLSIPVKTINALLRRDKDKKE